MWAVGAALCQLFLVVWGGLTDTVYAFPTPARELPRELHLLEDRLGKLRVQLLRHEHPLFRQNSLTPLSNRHRFEVYLLAGPSDPLPERIALKWDHYPTLFVDYNAQKQAALTQDGADQLMALNTSPQGHQLQIHYFSGEGRESELTLSVPKKNTRLVLILKPRYAGRKIKLVSEFLQDLSAAGQDQWIELGRRHAIFLYHRGKFSEAAGQLLASLEAQEDPAKRAELLLWLARTYLEWNLRGQAIETLKRLLDELPGTDRIRPQAWYYLQKAYYGQRQYESVTTLFARTETQFPPSVQAEMYYIAGQSFLYQKDYSRALAAFSQVPRGSRFYPPTRYGLGLAYLGFGDTYAAQQSLEKLIKTSDKDAWLKKLTQKGRLTLGFMLIEQNRYPEALKTLNALPTASPFFDQALFGTGWSYMKLGEYVKAIVVFRDLIERMSGSPYVHEAGIWVGYCYSKLNAYARAVSSYREALKASSQQISSLQQQMDRLRQQETALEELARAPWLEQGESLMIQNVMEKHQEITRLLSENRVEVGNSGFKTGFKVFSRRFASTLYDLSLQTLQKQRQWLEDLSVQAGIGIAINLALEKKEFGREELVFE